MDFSVSEILIQSNTPTVRATHIPTSVHMMHQDTLKATTINSSGNETLIFEYVKIAEGSYAAQYYLEGGRHLRMMAIYFDNDIVAFGTKKGPPSLHPYLAIPGIG